MKNIKIIILILVVIIVLAFFGVTLFQFNNNVSTTTTTIITTPVTPVTPPAVVDSSVTYKNSDYGFTFSLPADWKGYSIVKSTWKGYTQKENTVAPTGVTLLIRNPKWTPSNHYEDIPIMIFTIPEWNSYTVEDFYTSAAPFPASELGQNNHYVFALPPRWDYDYSQGFQEAENILASKPLHPFNL